MMFGSIAMYNSLTERWPGAFSIEKRKLDLSTNGHTDHRGSDALVVDGVTKFGE